MAEPVYARAALLYRERGWTGVLPIPPGKKKLNIEGFSGHQGVDPSGADIQEWIQFKPHWNIALRLPPGVIGIDVDAYDGKTGAATIAEAQKRWGALPDTIVSTSRTDGASCIRLYRIPPGTHLRDRIGFPELGIGHVEIAQNHHRYVVCWPSVHPEGRMYGWHDQRRDTSDEVACGPDDLPFLPDAWIEALRSHEIAVTAHVDVSSVLAALPQGRMSVPVERRLETAIGELQGKGSRHDTTRDNVLRLLRLAEQGDSGVPAALERLKRAYVVAISDRSDGLSAELEFDRMIVGQRGHDLIAATPTPDVYALAGLDKPLPATTTPTSSVAAPSVAHSPSTAPLETNGRKPDALSALFAGTISIPEPAADVEQVVEPLESRTPYLPHHVVDLASIEPTRPLIDGLLYQNTLAQISGKPGAYKTFLALGMACAIASPRTDRWCGYPVKTHGPVLYIAAEGVSGLWPRILGWCQTENVDAADLSLFYHPAPVQLGSATQISELTQWLRELGAVLVVVDTRARCSSGLEENSASEMGAAIEITERMRAELECTVLVIHHSGKAGPGGRGSSAWDGALWSDLRVKAEDKIVTLHCEKHKEVASGCEHLFEMKHVTVAPELMRNHDPFTRNTFVPQAVSTALRPNLRPKLLQVLNHSVQMSVQNILEEVGEGVSRSGVFYQLDCLVRDGLVIRTGSGTRHNYLLAPSEESE